MDPAQRFCKSFDGRLDPIHAVRAVAEHKALPFQRPTGTSRKRHRSYASSVSCGFSSDAGQLFSEPSGQIHASTRGCCIQEIGHLFMDRLNQSPFTLRVPFARLPDVTFERSLRDEVREHGLFDAGGLTVDRCACSGKRLNQHLWQNEIAHSERWKERLAESPDVHDAAISVETLQRRQRSREIAVLAVVIVLDDPGSGASRQVEQLEPARQTHGDAERTLVRGRDVSLGICRLLFLVATTRPSSSTLTGT